MIEPEQTDLTLGFVPLTDSAPLIVAKEMGFFSQWGLNVKFQKQYPQSNKLTESSMQSTHQQLTTTRRMTTKASHVAEV